MEVRAAPSLATPFNPMSSTVSATFQEGVNDDWTSTPIQVLDYDYHPYGSTRVSQQFSGFNEQKQYIGQYEAPQTNLNYPQASYYDGRKGEFLSEDQVFLTIGG